MIHQLLDWLDSSTSNVMAVKTIEEELKKACFRQLLPEEGWNIEKGDRCYMKVNETAIFAFITGQENPVKAGFHIITSHSDSPCFKIKPNAEMICEGGIIKLNVEKYGGGILYTWFDRPLSISGRVALKSDDPLRPRIVAVDLEKPVCTIPHLAIHFNRGVNEGNHLSVQKDMLPVCGIFSSEELSRLSRRGGLVKSLVAEKLNIDPADILDYELCLYPFEKASLCGVHGELFQSGRIDDLSMAFASLRAMLDTADTQTGATRIMAVFDNEETGSGTKQGAHSPAFTNLVRRIVRILGEDETDSFERAIANSFMISADDAHAWHPNYSGLYDPTNHALLGNGPVVKINSNCKYMSDADSAAVFRSICNLAGVNCQSFVNHSDVAGGSTLGNILTGQLPLRGVDVGAPILAMHSARETASVKDHEGMVAAFSEFFRL